MKTPTIDPMKISTKPMMQRKTIKSWCFSRNFFIVLPLQVLRGPVEVVDLRGLEGPEDRHGDTESDDLVHDAPLRKP
jgi:hypothetical protein